jgi:hypothetical protein
MAARTSSSLTDRYAICRRDQPACFWEIGRLFVVRTI